MLSENEWGWTVFCQCVKSGYYAYHPFTTLTQTGFLYDVGNLGYVETANI